MLSLILNCLASFVGLVLNLLLTFSIYNSVQTFLLVALRSNHLVVREPLVYPTSIESCVSQHVYVAGEAELRLEDVNEEGRRHLRNIAKTTVAIFLKAQHRVVRKLSGFYALFSFATMVFSIVSLASQDMDTLTTVVLSFYVVLVGLSNLFLIGICLLIAFSPLLCLLYCCCGANRQSNQFIDVPTSTATEESIARAGGICSICHMNFDVGERVFALPCADSHVFHCGCIRRWALVRNSCPICRAAIPMAATQRASQIGQDEE
jgi:hypothetical protein